MRVLIAERRPGVRLALRAILTHHPQIRRIGEVCHIDDLKSHVQQMSPDLVLLSWDMATETTLTMLHRVCTKLFVIVLSGRPEDRQIALNAGADAFVSKTDPPECLLAAILESKEYG